jgi:hypothetical protein
MTWLTSLSLSFRGHWSRLTDGSRQKKKTNANRLSKESNTLTDGKTTLSAARKREKEKKTKLTPRRMQLRSSCLYIR